MEAKYFKNHYSTGEIMNVVKSTEKRSIHVNSTTIRVLPALGNGYWNEEIEYYPASKEEFNLFYNEALETFKNFLDETVLEKA